MKPETVNEENIAPTNKEIETEINTKPVSTSDVKKEETTKKEPQIDVPKTDIKAEKKLENPSEKK